MRLNICLTLETAEAALVLLLTPMGRQLYPDVPHVLQSCIDRAHHILMSAPLRATAP
jgi:hypothetical protein